MDGATLHRVARERAEQLAGSVFERPFGPDWDVYKVGGKVFLLMTDVTGRAMVTLKAEPAAGEALRATYADVGPGYHMNKRHWVTLTPGESLTEQLVWELVEDSYDLVVEKLPKGLRPDAMNRPMSMPREH